MQTATMQEAFTGQVDQDRRVAEYAPLVKRIAYLMMGKLPPSVDVNDLIQCGMMGLLDAIGRYEGIRGAQFETYAGQRIRGAMLDQLRKADWVPREFRQNRRRIDEAVRALEQRYGRSPTEREIAAHLEVSMAEYQKMLQDARSYQLMSFDDFTDDGEESFFERHCADEGPDPFERLTDSRRREALVKAIDRLPEREKLVMSLHYDDELNFREIAEILGVTESRICQLHDQALSRLKDRMKNQRWLS